MTIAKLETPIKAYAAVCVTVTLWASSFPFIRVGVQHFAPIDLAALRFFTAALLMTVWLLWKRPALPSKRDCMRLMICAVIGIATYNFLLNTGQQTVSAGAASFIVNTVPVLTAVLAFFVAREQFGWWSWGGSFLSFTGIAAIAYSQPGSLQFGAGSTLILGAAFCQAIFFLVQRPLVTRYGAASCAAAVIIFGALCLAPWLPGAIRQANNVPLDALLVALYLGVFPAAIGYATWARAQAYFGASKAANFLYLVPPVALAMDFVITGELPDFLTIAGGSTAIAGVLIVNTLGKRRSSPTSVAA